MAAETGYTSVRRLKRYVRTRVKRVKSVNQVKMIPPGVTKRPKYSTLMAITGPDSRVRGTEGLPCPLLRGFSLFALETLRTPPPRACAYADPLDQ